MSIESKEDADVYIKKVNDALRYLTGLAEEAELYSQAAIFCIILAAFQDLDEIKILSKILGSYNTDALKRLGDSYDYEQELKI